MLKTIHVVHTLLSYRHTEKFKMIYSKPLKFKFTSIYKNKKSLITQNPDFYFTDFKIHRLRSILAARCIKLRQAPQPTQVLRLRMRLLLLGKKGNAW